MAPGMQSSDEASESTVRIQRNRRVFILEKVTCVLPYCGLLSALITEEKAPFQLEVSGNKDATSYFLT